MQHGQGAVSSGQAQVNQRKGLLQRISSPFGSTARTVVEFTIQADDPHRRYAPGDIIRGTIILKVARAVRITHIVVCLHGFVQVYKTPGVPPSDGFRAHNNLVGKGRGKRRGEYFGNGFATLFEDEHVVCGDGRLGEGNYKFQFEMRFPEETLPSSIDFERGTISYMITATLTRPTSISPVIFHDQKISYAERIDISKLLPPQPRTISLVALVRRPPKPGNPRRKTGTTDSTLQDGTVGSTAGGRSTMRSTTSLVDEESASGMRSPSPSIDSFSSRHSVDQQGSVAGGAAGLTSENGSARNSASNMGRGSKDIIITVESLTGGTLRGDTVPIRIFVNHTKHIKSMQGVIVTLYRHARVDTHPALPVGPTTDGEKRKFEDYYPKSLTGLGGLSLSGAGSSHIFRKDLSQAVLPLIIDPATLTAELSPRLRVPEDAFPTIACVPGSMISFRYYLEVILDIQGKFAGSDRYFGVSATSGGGDANINGGSSMEESTRWESSSYPRPLVDTTAIRRDRSVVTCVLEVVVGTLDSERRKGKQRAMVGSVPETIPRHNPSRRRMGEPDVEHVPGFSPLDSPWSERNATNDYRVRDHGDNSASMPRDDAYGFDSNAGYYDENGAYDWTNDDDPVEYQFSPPDVGDESGLTEKERLRRAELALLPSQPPDATGDDAEAAMPSAPSANDITSSDRFGPDDLGHIMTLDGHHGSSSAPRYSEVVSGGWLPLIVPSREEVQSEEMPDSPPPPPPPPKDTQFNRRMDGAAQLRSATADETARINEAMAAATSTSPSSRTNSQDRTPDRLPQR